MDKHEYEGFCTECDYQVESFGDLTECPKCGTKGIPCVYAEQVNITINWQELRILCMWAERWQNEVINKEEKVKTVYSIVDRIYKNHPELLSQAPLTLAAELRDLQEWANNNTEGKMEVSDNLKPYLDDEEENGSNI